MTVTAGVILLTYGSSYFLVQTNLINGELGIEPGTALLAAITTLVGGIGFALQFNRRPTIIVSAVSYALLILTAAYVFMTSDISHSPVIALWVLISLLSGGFGMYGLLAVALLTNGFILYALNGRPDLSLDQFITTMLTGELPLIVSYLLWRNTRTSDQRTSNISAYSELAAELTDVASKSEVVINAIADGVIALDRNGVIDLINPAAQTILGWGKEDALHLHYKSVLKVANAQGVIVDDSLNPIQQALSILQPLVTDDFSLVSNSGKVLLASLHISPSGKQNAGVIVVFRDITAEKKEEREQAEFISTASHEMRTPVAAIEGYLGLALNPQTATIDEKARGFLAKAHESAQHLGQLFQDLLDVTKAEDGRLVVQSQVVNLNDLVNNLCSDFNVKAQEKGLVLHCAVAPQDGQQEVGTKKVAPVYYSMSDVSHLREVVSNLIENAIKYTKEGTVTLDITGDEANAVVEVRDSGIGIPPEDIPHLFQKFYRVDNSDTREIGGTGLGLYLSRRLVEAMNGRLWVKSELGKGSTFYVQLPRISHEDAMTRLEQAAESQSRVVQPNAGAYLEETPKT